VAGQSVRERPSSFTVVLGGTTPTAGLAASASIVSVGPPLWARGPSRSAPWLASPVPALRQRLWAESFDRLDDHLARLTSEQPTTLTETETQDRDRGR
jgi:hypothetical protein